MWYTNLGFLNIVLVYRKKRFVACFFFYIYIIINKSSRGVVPTKTGKVYNIVFLSCFCFLNILNEERKKNFRRFVHIVRDSQCKHACMYNYHSMGLILISVFRQRKDNINRNCKCFAKIVLLSFSYIHYTLYRYYI